VPVDDFGLEVLKKAAEEVNVGDKSDYVIKVRIDPSSYLGSTILTGSGSPAGTLGKDTDFYLDTVTGNYYQKANGTWGSPVGNLTGPAGADGADGATGPTGPTGPQGPPGDGNINSASNVGTAGVGVFKQLNGDDLEFKKINAGSNKVTITDDTGNNEVDIDVTEANLTLNNIGGTLGETKGGTDQTSYTTGDILYSSSTNNLSKLAIGGAAQRLGIASGVPAWVDFFDPTTSMFLYDDFVGLATTSILGWSNNSSGTGAGIGLGDPSTLIDGNHQGIMRASTGTTTTGRGVAAVYQINLALGGGVLTYWTDIYIATLSTAGQAYVITIGLGDDNGSTEHGRGAYFYYAHGTNSGNWVGKTALASTRTSVNGSVAATTGWQRLKCVVNAGATSVEFFVNGTSIGTSTTNIPSGSSTWIAPMIKIVKSAGTTDREIDVDYFAVYQTFTSVR